MGIRDCAMASQAFRALHGRYTDRERYAMDCKAQGKRIIGCMGADVPTEILLAAGFVPYRIHGGGVGRLTRTDQYLEYAFDPVVRAQFEKLVDGTYRRLLDYLVISNSTDVLGRVFVYLREILRSEPEAAAPPAVFIDWLFSRNRMHQQWNEQTLGRFLHQVEGWACRELDAGSLEAAIGQCNRNRRALGRIAALRRAQGSRITGTEALVIIGAGFYTDPVEHTALVEALADEAEGWPQARGKRVFFTGSAQETTALYGMIEEAGLLIVGEDHDWGNRSFEGETSTGMEPVRAVVDRYMLRSFSAKKALVAQRVETLRGFVEDTGADGVIFYTNAFEEAASWDYPAQSKDLAGRGVATVSLHKMRYPPEENRDIPGRLAEFAERVRG